MNINVFDMDQYIKGRNAIFEMEDKQNDHSTSLYMKFFEFDKDGSTRNKIEHR